MSEVQKADIKKTLELVASKSGEIEKNAKKGGHAHTLAVCVNLLAAIVDGQEDRLAKLEREAAEPFARR